MMRQTAHHPGFLRLGTLLTSTSFRLSVAPYPFEDIKVLVMGHRISDERY